MSLVSWRYLALFLPLGWFAYRLLPRPARPWLLLGMSLWFYWLASGVLVAELFFFALVAWAAGRQLSLCRSRPGRAVIFTGATLLLGWRLWRVKYAPYLVLRWNALGLPELPYSQPAQALGLSFFSLAALGYLIEVWRGQRPLGLAAVLSGLGFFPAVTEGPIGRLHRLSPQLMAGAMPAGGQAALGAQRVLWGLFKKSVVADRAAILADKVFGSYTDYSGGAVALAALLYTLQLYGEFSGVMDIALGSAEGFGITLEENFRQPFFARSISDFWRRWHITLGAWLREYLFQPLVLSPLGRRLSRRGRRVLGPRLGALLPVWLGLAAVWLGMGLWHGPQSKYLVYGGYYCLLQTLGGVWETLCPAARRLQQNPVWRGFVRLRTMAAVCVGMLLFRAESLHAALFMLASLARPWEGSLLSLGLDAGDWRALAAGVLIMLGVDALKEKGLHLRRWLARRPLPLRWGAVWCGLLALLIFGAYGDGYDPANLVYAAF